MKHHYHVEAGRELIEAAQFYEAQRSLLGDEFLDEVGAGIAAILVAPERWPKLDDECLGGDDRDRRRHAPAPTTRILAATWALAVDKSLKFAAPA